MNLKPGMMLQSTVNCNLAILLRVNISGNTWTADKFQKQADGSWKNTRSIFTELDPKDVAAFWEVIEEREAVE